MVRKICVAAAQYPIEELASFAAFEAKLSRWVQQAVAHGAQLLVFPEYGAMELTSLAGRHVARDLQASLDALQYHLEAYEDAHASLAKKHGVFILAGSAPVRLTDGRFVNRARLFTPGPGSGSQEKQVMTRFEREQWGISASPGLYVFDIGIARLGISICYDIEFPLVARSLALSGAEIVLAPSCTDTLAGYHRVRIGSAARALENQIYTIMSPTIAEAPWSAAVDVNIGAARFFAPPDRAFPPGGVLAEGELNKPQWVYADLDLGLLQEVRRNGEVLNDRDWELQPGAGVVPEAKLVSLS
jgi:predicted amidohydrolase